MGYDYLPNLIHINDEFNFLINIYIYIFFFTRGWYKVNVRIQNYDFDSISDKPLIILKFYADKKIINLII
jgi:hypothetical protein